MRSRIFKSNTFACFSPLVMALTFAVEIWLILYSLLTRKINTSLKLGVLILLFLATFQLAEYGVCLDFVLPADIWAKIGFAAITFLPVLGLHLVFEITNKYTVAKHIIYIAYLFAVCWVIAFLFTNILQDTFCSGNYVIFKIKEPIELFYYIYYDFLLLIAILFAYYFASNSKDKRQKVALYSLIVGYLSFIIPSVIIRFLNENNASANALPSILCGFAVLLALILTFKTLPNSTDKRD